MRVQITVSVTVWGWLVGVLWAFVALAAGAAPPAASVVLTILDGQAVIYVGARALVAAEGLRLPEAAIVETSPSTTLLRLEFSDGSALDLGPDTKVMVLPGALGRRGEAAPAHYLLAGWVKQRSASAAPHRGHVSSQLEALPAQGAAVAHVSPESSWLFVEAGAAAVVERSGASARLSLPAGTSYLRRGAAKGEVAARPDPDLLRRVPRGFRDTIGLRAAHFAGKEVAAKPLPAPDYAALRPWLAAEPALRREFPRRFAPLLRDSAFRAALAAQLGAHPEWERALYPERFEPVASSPKGGSR